MPFRGVSGRNHKETWAGKGYERLFRWAEDFGPVRCAGIESASSYGTGRARHLRAMGIEVLEVERPKNRRRSSRRNVKSDPSDAERAAPLLIVAGDNPQRLRSEASFVSLCGVAPIEASSGKVVRHRVNRGGNREASRALYMICLARMRRDRRTQEYVARRTTEGNSKREIIRSLKRYVAREVYRELISCGARSSPTGP